MIKELEKIGLPKERQKYLLKNSNMKELYLAECLDSCSWGSSDPNACRWEMTTLGMINFIDSWMKLNKGHIKERLYEGELKYKPELPHIDRGVCPDHNKKGIKFPDGIIRCTYLSSHSETRTFFKQLMATGPYTQTQVQDFIEENPILNEILVKTRYGYVKAKKLSCEEEEILKELGAEFQYKVPNITHRFGSECKIIISDKALNLSLETILNRLKLPPSYTWNKKNSEFPLGGRDLAGYVEKWLEQEEVLLLDKNRKL